MSKQSHTRKPEMNVKGVENASDLSKILHDALDYRIKEMAEKNIRWGGATMSRFYDDGKFIHIDIFSPNKDLSLEEFMKIVKEQDQK